LLGFSSGHRRVAWMMKRPLSEIAPGRTQWIVLPRLGMHRIDDRRSGRLNFGNLEQALSRCRGNVRSTYVQYMHPCKNASISEPKIKMSSRYSLGTEGAIDVSRFPAGRN
jgi:hypothetical protein